MQMEALFAPKPGVLYENWEGQDWPGNYFIIREDYTDKSGVRTITTDFYGETLDGYQEPDEETFKAQRTYYFYDGKMTDFYPFT